MNFDQIAEINTRRVLAAFRKHRVSEASFAPTTGYGYGDRGRETLNAVYADVFGAERALVSLSLANGTAAITTALFAALRPGDTLLSATGKPYDTLQTAIGISGSARGTLLEWGVSYLEAPLTNNGDPDFAVIAEHAENPGVKAVLIQRSRGYSSRLALSVTQIGDLVKLIHEKNPSAAVIVDNCYGEFVGELEPTALGADLAAGSLIKNPGGGLSTSGGYIAGRGDLVEAAAERLTSPGIGSEAGSNALGYRLLFQGLFMAPHVVAQALKTADYAARVFSDLGYDVSPKPGEMRHDIIQSIKLGSKEKLIMFCNAIQENSPVDSFVSPEPWAMPGYDCDVIMAAGTFVSGASIELSADAPLREPYTVYLQGGLTYESGKIAIDAAADAMS